MTSSRCLLELTEGSDVRPESIRGFPYYAINDGSTAGWRPFASVRSRDTE
jgi:hypothetical protein